MTFAEIRWTEKNVLVTGGKGFLGSYIVQHLQERKVKKIISPSSQECDLTNLSDCRRILRDIDIVFHAAGRTGGIGLNREKPAELFYENLMMGMQLINESKNADIEKLIAIGTICSYPKYAPIPFSEESLWDGYPEETNAPYGLAKKMLLVQSQAYRQQYGFKAIVVIPTNLFGPKDNFNQNSSHVIPAIIMKIRNANDSQSKSITIWGDGSATRDFLYVDDAANGIILAAEKYNDTEPINLGSGHEVSIKELVTIIADLMDYKGTVYWDTTKPNGQPRRCVSNKRSKEKIGFQPSVGLEEGLKRTIKWFSSKHNKNSSSIILH
jgi:GDP-L-fucose synthase